MKTNLLNRPLHLPNGTVLRNRLAKALALTGIDPGVRSST